MNKQHHILLFESEAKQISFFLIAYLLINKNAKWCYLWYISSSRIFIIILIIQRCWQHGFHWFFFSIPSIDHYCTWKGLLTTSSVHTELMNARYCWSTNTCVSMYKKPLENVANELFLILQLYIFLSPSPTIQMICM